VLLEGEVVRHDEVVAPVLEEVALDGGLIVELSVVVPDGEKPVVVLDAMLVVELGVLLRELDMRIEEAVVEEAEVEEVEEVGLVDVVVVDTK